MSAIAGLLDLQGRVKATEPHVDQMLATMRHRGSEPPCTVAPTPGVVLGECRLATIDASATAQQVTRFDDDRYTLTCDGVIANYVELREELEQHGFQFHTHSDSEVLVRAYQHWGIEALNRFNGMWAFALYDREQQTLVCARDRFGIKPFYYAIHNGCFHFASEAKAILAIEPSLAEPDYDSLSRILRASVSATGPRTCFRNIQRLDPAHYMLVSARGQKQGIYWHYPQTSLRITLDDAADQLRELLTDSTRLLCRGDQRPVLALSSGLDSAALAICIRSFSDETFHTFTSSHPGDPEDESQVAAEIARSLNMEPHAVTVETSAFLPTLRRIVRYLECPTHSPSVFPLWSMMGGISELTRVVLNGAAADVLMDGATDRLHRVLMAHLREAEWRQAYLQAAWKLKRQSLSGSVMQVLRESNVLGLHRMYRRFRGDEAVYIGPLQDAAEYPETENLTHRDKIALSSLHRLAGMRGNLHFRDSISMAYGVETRYPYLDYRVVEFCLSLPGGLNYRDGHGKYVLRRAMRDRLPEELLFSRAKVGFAVPIARWFREEPESTVYPVLRAASCRDRGVFLPAAVDKAVQKHVRGEANLSSQIFRWIITELWFQEFIDQRAGVAIAN